MPERAECWCGAADIYEKVWAEMDMDLLFDETVGD
jgi:hypothetical protein